jgi:uncharacterized protein GlcG (DUF336 family)
MEQLPVSEVLPGLYRAVLDAVAELEAYGRRGDAATIRADATAAYSKAWDAAAERRLRSLRARADKIVAARRRAYTGPPATPRHAVDMERTTARPA